MLAMQMKEKGEQGGALSGIVGNSASWNTVRTIEQLLGIDTVFPAVPNIVEKLLHLLELLHGATPHGSDWLSALRTVQEAGEQSNEKWRWVRAASTPRAGNPMGGKFKRYPLPAFFLQEAMSDIETQAEHLHRLFLLALLKKQSASGLVSAADELRKLIAGGGANSSIRLLPKEVGSDWSDWIEVLESCPSYDRLAARLLPMLRAVNTTTEQPMTVAPVPLVTSGRGEKNGRSERVSRGMLPSHRLGLVDPGDSATAQPPRYVDLHATTSELTEQQPVSEHEINARSRETRHWISRHQRMTPNDYARFTLIERKWMAARIRELLQSENKELRLGAGLVAMMYLTGMQLDALLDARVGAGGVFDIEGVYRRTIRMPVNAYTPDAQVLDQFLPKEETLILQLPTVLAAWVDALVQDKVRTMLALLDVPVDKAAGWVDRVMAELRDGGRYTRLRRERLTPALGIELNLRYHDTGLTFHLALGDAQGAPMVNYYVAHRIEELQRSYRETTESMLQV